MEAPPPDHYFTDCLNSGVFQRLLLLLQRADGVCKEISSDISAPLISSIVFSTSTKTQPRSLCTSLLINPSAHLSARLTHRAAQWARRTVAAGVFIKPVSPSSPSLSPPPPPPPLPLPGPRQS
ncbi:unnamed protein product [Pleuronectes platessa]|uniref:Uncharacterized protein n=1 Tax=Pleuronectes platessa TaxID=8262 RepID=A0A9N7VMH3_PLEPL|nr:unnamed protein product [Pleuronectes platessa]